MYFLYETPLTMGLILLGFIIAISAQTFVNSAYTKYSRIGNKKGLTGFETARKILDKNGLNNVHVVETKGVLSDHYDPIRKVVRLSTDNFHGDSIAAVSIAAHEASHAVQHKVGYLFIKIRGFIFPYVNIGSKLGYFAIFIGLFSSITDFIMIGVVMLLGIVLFELVTLPVEYDASSRAKKEMIENSVLDYNEINKASNMLNAAALTYVAAIATTLLQILRLILIANSRRRR